MWYFRFIGPIFDALSEEYTDIEFVKVDVDKAHKVKALCGIHTIPTFQLDVNPGVKNATGAMYLRANHPAYG